MKWNCLRSLSCCCRRAGDVFWFTKCLKMLVVFFKWLYIHVLNEYTTMYFLQTWIRATPTWCVRDILKRDTANEFGVKTENNNNKKNIKCYCLTRNISGHLRQRGYNLVPPFFLPFFFKKGGPYISKKPIGGWRFFVCANKISRCSLFIASRLQTALSSPRALHLLSSPLNGITNQRIYFTVATKRRGKKKWAQWSLYHMCVFV